jgi:hypothetical protein
MPFKSKAQQRFMFAAESRGELPEGTAKRWADETRNIKKLPEKVKTVKTKKTSKKAEAILLRKVAAAQDVREKACMVLRYTHHLSHDKRASLGLATVANELLRTSQPLSKLAMEHLGLPEKAAKAFSAKVAQLVSRKERSIRQIRKAAQEKKSLESQTIIPPSVSVSLPSQATLDAALPLAALGAYPAYRTAKGFLNAPDGYGVEGAARGALRGTATTGGAIGGGLAGLLAGGTLASQMDLQRNPNLALAALIGSPILGAVGGGYLGNRLTAGGLEPSKKKKQRADFE